MKKYLLVTAVLPFLIAGCDPAQILNARQDNKIQTESKSDKFTYELELNGCKTGKHEFNSQDEYCKGLQNNSLNNYCARSLREDLFKKECPGQFSSLNQVSISSILDLEQIQSEDVIYNDSLVEKKHVRTLHPGQTTLVFVNNTSEESSKVVDEKNQKGTLIQIECR